MIGKNRFKLLLLLLTVVLSCGSDDENNLNNDDESVLYLKSWKYVDTDFSYLDQYFTFEGNLLVSASGSTSFNGEYQYDNNDNLIQRINGNNVYSYEYDSQNRLTKESLLDSNAYIELMYESNTVTINKYFTSASTQIESIQLTLDEQNRIVRVEIISSPFIITYAVQEYTYDNQSNIIQHVYKDSPQGTPEVIVNFQYDDKKSPYFYALAGLYKSIYFLECRKGIPLVRDRGITPNNFTAYGSSEEYSYVYNDFGFPVSYTRTSINDSEVIIRENVYEYY